MPALTSVGDGIERLFCTQTISLSAGEDGELSNPWQWTDRSHDLVIQFGIASVTGGSFDEIQILPSSNGAPLSGSNWIPLSAVCFSSTPQDRFVELLKLRMRAGELNFAPQLRFTGTGSATIQITWFADVVPARR